MTQKQELDIQTFIEKKIESIDVKHQKLKRWLIGIIIGLLSGFIIIGYTEVVNRVSNSSRLDYIETKVNETIPFNVLLDVHKTYEMEFFALAAFIEGDDQKLSKVMEEFSSYRWSLLDDYVYVDAGRGGNFVPWWRPFLPNFRNKNITKK